MTKNWRTRVGIGLQILCAVLIALGALGHSVATGPRIHSSLVASNLDAELQRLVIVVWHFAGLCMALLGGLVAFAVRWTGLTPAALAVAMAYTAFGLVAWAWSGLAFFSVFAVLGLAVLAAMRLRCGGSSGRADAREHSGIGS